MREWVLWFAVCGAAALLVWIAAIWWVLRRDRNRRR